MPIEGRKRTDRSDQFQVDELDISSTVKTIAEEGEGVNTVGVVEIASGCDGVLRGVRWRAVAT